VRSVLKGLSDEAVARIGMRSKQIINDLLEARAKTGSLSVEMRDTSVNQASTKHLSKMLREKGLEAVTSPMETAEMSLDPALLPPRP
jgi:antitoxin component of RelBE/YafQ-DinJ toxin-antitoxin module